MFSFISSTWRRHLVVEWRKWFSNTAFHLLSRDTRSDSSRRRRRWWWWRRHIRLSSLFLPQLNERGWLFISYFATHSLLSVTLPTSSKMNHILFSSLANVLVHGNHVFRGTTSSLRFSSLKQRSSDKFTFRLCFGLACWYFRILQKEKKKNEFYPCFFNYNSIVARDSDVSVLQDFSGIINSVGNIKWRKYN